MSDIKPEEGFRLQNEGHPLARAVCRTLAPDVRLIISSHSGFVNMIHPHEPLHRLAAERRAGLARSRPHLAATY
jgi:hypothetical protein